MTVARPSSCSLTFVFVALLSSTAVAQCGLTWLPGPAGRGPDDSVAAVLPLPNGELIAGGTFVTADAVVANGIARWDGIAWRALGSGSDGAVRCLARLANGDIVAGGTFTTMGGVACDRIARWNGAQWAPMGVGFDQEVSTLLALPGGELVAGGLFANAGAVPMARISRWNGFAWTAVGPGLPAGRVGALARLPNGDLVAARTGTAVPIYGLDRWDGTAWQSIPGLDATFPANVDSLAVLANGTLALSGSFLINSTFPGVAIWNGSTMQPLTTPVIGNPRQVLAASNGDLIVGGSPGSPTNPSLARWDGSNWTAIFGGPVAVRALAQDAIGRLVVGSSPGASVPPGSAVSRYDGNTWQQLGAPAPAIIHALVRMANGDVLAGGDFSTIEGVAADNVARWNGSSWLPLGSGVDGAVRAIAVAANGDVIVSGAFQNAGGAPASRVARWNGNSWSTMASGLPFVATSLAATANGDVFASALANNQLRRWDGAVWSPVSLPGPLALVQGMAPMPNGDLVLAGSFSNVGPVVTGVVRYSSGVITAVPGAPPTAFRIFAMANGDLVASGGAGVQRWNGSAWTVLGSQNPLAFAELPDGSLVAGGNVTNIDGQASALFRYGAGGPEALGPVRGGAATCLSATAAGALWVGGEFHQVGGSVAAGLVRALPTCPGGAVPAGAGCAGGAGVVALQAINTPWLGGTFRAAASGMTGNSIALQLFGSAAAPQSLPLGAPGCSLLVAPAVSDVLLPANGNVSAAITVPNSAGLIGAQFRMQVVGVELGSLGIVRLTGSNALDLTVGSF